MSFEIQPSTPGAPFLVDPQVGANESIAPGDTLILSGGNAAIQTSNGGVDTVNINLVLDPAPANMLSITGTGLLFNLCNMGGFLEAQAGSVGIGNAVDIPWLAGRDPVSNCLVPVNLANTLVPFGTAAGGWGAHSAFNYNEAAGRLSVGIYRTTNPPTAPTLPILAYVENATGDIGKFALNPGDLVIGGAGGEVSQLAPGSCAPLTVQAVNGLGVNPVSGAWENILFREKLPSRAVAAATTLLPATDGVIRVNNSAASVVVTLNTPTACEPNVFHIKQVNGLTTNVITLTPTSGTIEGVASHSFGGTNSTQFESRMIHWDGTNWHVI